MVTSCGAVGRVSLRSIYQDFAGKKSSKCMINVDAIARLKALHLQLASSVLDLLGRAERPEK